MDALRAMDHIAYIRFASVYRPFADLSALKEAVIALEGNAPEAGTVQLSFPGAEPVAAPAERARIVTADAGRMASLAAVR